MKYKIGDKVKVINDLQQAKIYEMDDGKNGVCATSGMLYFAGKVVTIKGIGANDGMYRIEEYPCLWVDEMFECACIQDKEKVDFILDVCELLK